MIYDTAAIMSAAHKSAREMFASDFLRAGRTYPRIFAGQLCTAWRRAKELVAAKAARVERDAMSEADKLRQQIVVIENRTRLDWKGQQELSSLREALRASEAEEQAKAQRCKRSLIAGAAGRFCTVTFIKADGSERSMRVQYATMARHIKGNDASRRGRRAAETRARNHPRLMPVWDVDKAAIRSVNLDTVTRIEVDGRVHDFTE